MSWKVNDKRKVGKEMGTSQKTKQKELTSASSNRTLLQSHQVSIWLPKRGFR